MATSASFCASSLISLPTPRICCCPVLFIFVVHHQSYLALTINVTNANQALVRHARLQAEGAKVAHVDTAARKRLMELRHQRFVIGVDRPKRNVCSIFHGEL